MPILVSRCKNGIGLLVPAKAKDGDAGFDLRAAIFDDETLEIMPSERCLIPTGFAWEIPKHWAGLIRPRSGLALGKGLHILAGVVDSGYRDEVRVLVVNLGLKPISISRGDQIAQLLVVQVNPLDLVTEVDELSDTVRGTDGFGSTGR